jgi:predicted MFS family arabinose efflux permease
VLASVLSAALTPWTGRVVDRRGTLVPLTAGLGLSAVLIALLPLPQSALLLAILTIVALGGPLIAATMPAMSMMTEAVDQIGVALVFGTMLLNVAWSLGETIGAPAAATLSRATSDAIPLLALAGAMLATLVVVLAMRKRSREDEAVSSTSAPRWSDQAADPQASRRVFQQR